MKRKKNIYKPSSEKIWRKSLCTITFLTLLFCGTLNTRAQVYGDNDIGISELIIPVGFCSGTYQIKVKVVNYGINTVDSFRVNWRLNNVTQPTAYYKISLDPIGGSNPSDTIITLGSYTLQQKTKPPLEAWTSHPNGVSDTVTANDTLYTHLQTALNGTYTVGGQGPDYTTLNQAVQALNTYGICGPVVFTVRPGTYNENIELEEIAGSSSVNTVTFMGSGKNQTYITYSTSIFGGLTGKVAVIALHGTDHMIFRDMTVTATGLLGGMGIELSRSADSNDFSNMNIDISAASAIGTSFYGIITYDIWVPSSPGLMYALTANFNHFDSLIVKGGVSGILIAGSDIIPGGYCIGNQITHCEFSEQTASGIYGMMASDIIIDGNKIHNQKNPFGNSFAIQFQYVNNLTLSNNYIQTDFSGALLMGVNTNSHIQGRSRIYNNIFSNEDGNSTTPSSFNLMVQDGIDLDIHHNTFTGKTVDGLVLLMNTTGLDLRNNIFARYDPGKLLNLISCSFDHFDYNLYYDSSAGNLAEHDGNIITSLAAWQAQTPAFNKNSVAKDPSFLSKRDLHLLSALPPATGEYIGIDTDIDGDPRCNFSPSMGADESQFIYPYPDLKINQRDSIFKGSPATIAGNYHTSGEKVIMRWYVDGAYITNTENLDYTFQDTGSYTVALYVRNCSGDDSITEVIRVYEPTLPPVTDFITANSELNLMDSVIFRDISKNGPTDWLWSVSPGNNAAISNENSPTPYIQFFASGYYDVCLTTSNAIGKHTLCKTAYILVNDEQELCDIIKESSMPNGRLSDNGGLFGNYTPYQNCNFQINTCSQIQLTFTRFDVPDSNDILRIYDGTGQNRILLREFKGGSTIALSSKLTAHSGKMYIEWSSNATIEGQGFEAYWKTLPGTAIKSPVADFTTPSAVYTNSPALLQSVAQNKLLNYSWNFDVADTSGSHGSNSSSDYYTWDSAGTYDVRLQVSNCAGSHDTIKQVTVIDPVAAPSVYFYADKLRIPVYGKVKLSDTSSQGSNSWKWEITPAADVVFKKADHIPTTEVQFTKPGSYTVKLTVGNHFGTDSLVKTAYIEVYSYCSPGVTTINSDIGISNVTFGHISNTSAIGVAPYSNYTEFFEPVEVTRRDSFTITVERTTLYDSMSRKLWIDWNQDADFEDSLEEVAYEAPATQKSFTVTIAVPHQAIPGTTVLRIGTSYSNYDNLPCGFNVVGEFEDYMIKVIDDLNPPVITLLGNSMEKITVHHPYSEAGATARDYFNNDLTGSVLISGHVDTAVLGTYTLSYTVTDVAGNTDSVTRIVEVADDVKPEIQLVNKDTLYIEVNHPYNEPGYTVSDNYNSSSGIANSVDSSAVNISKTGIYQVIYTATDSSNNTATVTRWIVIRDTTAPEMLLNGNDTVYVDVHRHYAETGVQVTDNYCINGWNADRYPNIDVLGDYLLTYSATDCEGNTAKSLQRLVRVVDREAPVIILKGDPYIKITRWQTYVDSGIILRDNYNSESGLIPLVDVSSNLDVFNTGIYTICYEVSDSSGNKSSRICRVIEVIESTSGIDHTLEEELNLYPNPSNGKFTLHLNSGFTAQSQVFITDMLGRTVREVNIEKQENTLDIDATELPAGVYFVKVNQGTRSATVKISIVH